MGKSVVRLSALLVLLTMLAACGGSKAAQETPAPAPAPAGGESASSTPAPEAWKPSKPIEYVAPAGAGGGWDTTARTTAKVLNEEKIITQPLTVVNKTGGGGAVGWKYIFDKSGDDLNHTLFVTSPPIIFVPLNGNSDLTHRDFQPIAALTADYAAFIVRADSPYKTLTDLMNALKTEPGKVSVAGTSAPGSMDHMQFLLAAEKAGVDVSKVRYVSFQGAEGMAQLLGGHVTVFSSDVGDAIEQYRAGKVRVLGVTAPKRLEGDAKDFPTVKEQGIDMEFTVWRGVMAHKKMSPEAVKFYEEAFRQMSKNSKWIEARENLGWRDNFMEAATFGKFLNEQYDHIEAVMTRAGLKK